jgi:hypothetical protein
MPTRADSLKVQLSRASEITIGVTGRKSGRTISNPVWFVLDGDKLYLLPVWVRHRVVQECPQESDDSG